MEYLNITAQWRLDLNFGTAEMKVIKHIIWQQGGENYKKHQCRKCGIACYCMVLTTEYYALLFLQFHFICATPDDTGRYKRTLVRLGVIFGLQEDPG